MKKIFIIGGGSLFVLLIGVFITFYPFGMMDIELKGIDPGSLTDGSYTGTFEQGRFTNTLTVHIQNNRIVKIDIVRDLFGAEAIGASDEVFRRVMEKQDTKIDAVTGSTVTMNAYLKAIENALPGR